MTTKHKYRLYKSRRVIRRHLREASFGWATTVYGALVTLAAFFALWVVIMRCIVEDDPHRWMLNTLETGNYAIEQLELYRIENDGNLPEDYYLDLDASLGGRLEIKGVRAEE